jgi:hypothetical protein
MFPKQVFDDRRQLCKEIQQLPPDQLRDNAQALLIIVAEFQRSLELQLRIIQQVKGLDLGDRDSVQDFTSNFADYVGQQRFNLERTRCNQIRRIYRQQIVAGATGPDRYVPYEVGLRLLLNGMGRDHDRFTEALTYEQRLTENIDDATRYGDTPTNDADRARIIAGLNKLALETLGESFNDLCKRARSSTGQAPATPLSRELEDFLQRFGNADLQFTEQIEPLVYRALDAVKIINGHVQSGELGEARRLQQEFAREYEGELDRVGRAIDEMTQVGNQLIDLLE